MDIPIKIRVCQLKELEVNVNDIWPFVSNAYYASVYAPRTLKWYVYLYMAMINSYDLDSTSSMYRKLPTLSNILALILIYSHAINTKYNVPQNRWIWHFQFMAILPLYNALTNVRSQLDKATSSHYFMEQREDDVDRIDLCFNEWICRFFIWGE